MEETQSLVDQQKLKEENREITNEQIYKQVLKARQISHWEPILNFASFFVAIGVAYVSIGFTNQGLESSVLGWSGVAFAIFGVILFQKAWRSWLPLWHEEHKEVERLLKGVEGHVPLQ